MPDLYYKTVSFYIRIVQEYSCYYAIEWPETSYRWTFSGPLNLIIGNVLLKKIPLEAGNIRTSCHVST